MNWLAAAVLGLAVLGACAPTGTAGHDDSRLYGFAEFEQHLTEHLRTVSDANHTATVAKAEALARLARAYMARTAKARRCGHAVVSRSRPGHVLQPPWQARRRLSRHLSS